MFNIHHILLKRFKITLTIWHYLSFWNYMVVIKIKYSYKYSLHVFSCSCICSFLIISFCSLSWVCRSSENIWAALALAELIWPSFFAFLDGGWYWLEDVEPAFLATVFLAGGKLADVHVVVESTFASALSVASRTRSSIDTSKLISFVQSPLSNWRFSNYAHKTYGTHKWNVAFKN